MKDTKHNGYSNWETWEAYNMITSFEGIYNDAVKADALALKKSLAQALYLCAAPYDHIDTSKVDFDELADAIKGSK